MIIYLLDFEGGRHSVEVPDSTKEISGTVISGDMVMTEPFYFDTRDDRLADYNDGDFSISVEKLAEIKSSYDVFD